MTAIRTQALPESRRQFISEKSRRELSKWFTVLVCVTPGMVVFLLFLLIPIAQSARYSLYNWNGFGPLSHYKGVQFYPPELPYNYHLLYINKVFKHAIQNSFLIMLMSLGIQLPFAMAMALMVGRGTLPGKAIFRTIFFIPFVFSEVITGIIWRYVLHPTNAGLANTIFGTVVPGYHTVGFLSNQNVVMYAIFAVITWKYFGFYMILYMAGLQAVSKDLEDAARIDGANESRVLRHITLPLMGSTIRLTAFLSILGSFQQFVIIWVLTQGGPVNSSQVVGTFLYKYGIKNNKLGLSSAIAIVLFAITLVFSLGYQRMVMRQDYGDLV